MVVLVACGNKGTNERFSMRMVEDGIEPHNAENKQELFEKLQDREFDAVVLDMESDAYEGTKTIREIKVSRNVIPIIVLTYKTGMPFAREMVDVGVYGFVSKTKEFENQIKQTISLLDSTKTRKKEKRKYIRIKPNESQRNDLVVQIRGIKKNYRGKVKDISLGGIAAKLSENVLDSLLYPGIIINIEFSLGKITAESQAKVIAKKGYGVALSFMKMSSVTRKKISEYILSTIK